MSSNSSHSPRKSKPRVLLVVESAAAGTGRHVIDLAEGLVARGCDVHLFHSSGRIDQNFQKGLARMKSVPRAARLMYRELRPSDYGAVRAVRRYMREHGPFDIVHGHSSKGGALARLAAFGTGSLAFYTIHGLSVTDPGMGYVRRTFYLTLERILSRLSSRIIAVSPEEMRASVQLGLGESRLAMVPNGVDPQELTPRDQTRCALGVKEDAVLIGFVGRLVGPKSPDTLLRAFAAVVANAPHARLAMIGDGPLADSLRELGDSLGIGRKVLWLGAQNAQEFYSAFDIFALPSRKEGLPYVVLEAMAAGLPVVATDTAGVEILVDDGKTGYVLPLGDTDAFAVALGKITLDASLRRQFGAAAQEKSKLFTVDQMVNQTLATYLDAISASKAAQATVTDHDYEDAVLVSDGDLR